MDEMSGVSCCITEHAVSSHHFHVWQIFYRKVQLIASAFEKQPFLQAGGAGWHAQEEVREDVCVCVCGGVSVGGCGVSWHTHSLYQKIQKSHPVVGIVSMGWAWAFRPQWATEALIIYLADTENYSNWSVNTPTHFVIQWYLFHVIWFWSRTLLDASMFSRCTHTSEPVYAFTLHYSSQTHTHTHKARCSQNNLMQNINLINSYNSCISSPSGTIFL